MATITTIVCDSCEKPFEAAPSHQERYVWGGARYTDAAGSTDSRTFTLEMHEACWRKFARACAERADD